MRSDLIRMTDILRERNEPVTPAARMALWRKIRARERELGTRLLVVPKRGAPAQCSPSLLHDLMPELFASPAVAPSTDATVRKIFARHEEELDELRREIEILKEEIGALKQAGREHSSTEASSI